MRHFITFQKVKGLFIESGDSNIDNSSLVHQINHELMKVGYVLDKSLFDTLSHQNEGVLQDVYSDLQEGIKRVVGTSGYEPIYRNFPQSVLNMSYTEFLVNAIVHYWSYGTWRPEDAEYVNREFKLEAVDYKSVSLLNESQYISVFDNILNSGTSISRFDKECLDYYLDNYASKVNLGNIKFKETLAYVGKRLLSSDSSNLPTAENGEDILPTRNATDVLRMLAAYSGGDEGLKERTKFKNLSSAQRRLVRNTLDNCYNLEDSFKSYREVWLRVLFYLNPRKYQKRYPNLGRYTDALRNHPKSLETFNAKVERMIKEKDESIFDLLSKSAGVFTRRLDHLVRVFGKTAIERYVDLKNINFTNLANAYNHFDGRDQEQSGRGAILASQDQSKLVTYDSLEPLDKKLVSFIRGAILSKLKNFRIKDDKSYFIDRSLYYSPMNMNNRASELSLDQKCLGETLVYEGNKTLRMYVHWEGNSDIDLSGFIITKDNSVQKIGWNAHHHLSDFIVYSGDNTGYSSKNAEYLDINTGKMPKNVEWIIVDANIFSGKSSFEAYKGKAHIGWMETAFPEAHKHWQPSKLMNARTLSNGATIAYLMAYHAPTKSIVYLDMSANAINITNENDALKMRMFLETFVTLDNKEEISWNRLNKGHLLELRLNNVVQAKEEADVVFDSKTSTDEISNFINS